MTVAIMGDLRSAGPWLARHRRAKLSPRLVVYSVPPVGAGAGAHRELALAADDDIEVLTLRLPGRESRRREASLDTMEKCVEDLLAKIGTHAADHQLPFALLGDCLTSLLAYELARALQRSGSTRLVAMVAVTCRAPHHHLRQGARRPATATDDLRAQVIEQGLIAPEIAEDPEALALFEAIVRADLAVYEDYVWDGHPLEDTPVVNLITAEHGRETAFTSWEETTGKESHLVTLDGSVRPALAVAASLSRVRDLVEPGSRVATASPTLREQVVNIWASFFPHSRGADDEEFLGIGGDSIAAVRLRNALRRRLGSSPPLEVILGGVTLGEIVTSVTGHRSTTTGVSEEH